MQSSMIGQHTLMRSFGNLSILHATICYAMDLQCVHINPTCIYPFLKYFIGQFQYVMCPWLARFIWTNIDREPNRDTQSPNSPPSTRNNICRSFSLIRVRNGQLWIMERLCHVKVLWLVFHVLQLVPSRFIQP